MQTSTEPPTTHKSELLPTEMLVLITHPIKLLKMRDYSVRTHERKVRAEPFQTKNETTITTMTKTQQQLQQ
jgi:hypothetical protein